MDAQSCVCGGPTPAHRQMAQKGKWSLKANGMDHKGKSPTRKGLLRKKVVALTCCSLQLMERHSIKKGSETPRATVLRRRNHLERHTDGVMLLEIP